MRGKLSALIDPHDDTFEFERSPLAWGFKQAETPKWEATKLIRLAQTQSRIIAATGDGERSSSDPSKRGDLGGR